MNSIRSGKIENINDEDWWGVYFFEPDKNYIIETSGDNGSTTDTVLYLYRECDWCDQLYTQIDKNDEGGEGYGSFSKIEFTAPSDVSQYKYYVMVKGYTLTGHK